MTSKFYKLSLAVIMSLLICVGCKESITDPHDDTLKLSSATTEALKALYDSTEGDSWTSNDGWFTDDYNAWYGVTFDLLTGEVTSIELDNNNLTGTVPVQIANLLELETLVLSNNNLSGVIPDAVLNHANWEAWDAENNILAQNADYGFKNADILDPTHPDLVLLKALYKATEGAAWTDHSYWMSTKSIDQWYGIKTNGEGRVTEINLAENNLVGNIVNVSFTGFDAITKIDLGGNNLIGTMPVTIADIAGLESCVLSGNLYDNTTEVPLAYAKHSTFENWDVVSQQNDVTLTIENPVDVTTFPDYSALKALYDALGGDSWTNNTNWMVSDQNFKYWQGVEVNDEGRVVAIKLPGNNLAGELPSEIAGLEMLTTLDLSANSITGTIPAEFKDLANLTSLVLKDNATMSGDIASAALENVNYSAWGAIENIIAGTSLTISDRDILAIFYRSLGGENWIANTWMQSEDLSTWTGVGVDADGNVTKIDLVNGFGYGTDVGYNGTVPAELTLLKHITDFRMRCASNPTYVVADCNVFLIPTITYLQINNMGVIGELDGAKVGAMVDCTYFQMNQCRIDGRGPEDVLTGPIPAEFGELHKLTKLEISLNGFTGNIPDTFTKANFPEMPDGAIAIQYNCLGGGDYGGAKAPIPAVVATDISLFNANWDKQAYKNGICLPE